MDASADVSKDPLAIDILAGITADNIKLQSRARGIVAKIANVSEEKAGSALVAAGGDVKTAIMIAAQGLSEPEATAALQQANGHLRLALKQTPVMG